MNCKINIDKFICFLIENKSDARQLLEICLRSQGLEYKDGEIVEIEEIIGKEENVSPIPPLTDEKKSISRIQHAQACADKGLSMSPYVEGVIPNIDEQNILMYYATSTKENNKPQTIKFNKECLMEIAKPESIEEKYNIDIEKMVGEYKERILISRSLKYDDLLVRAIAYKQGLKDMLKVIKEGGE